MCYPDSAKKTTFFDLDDIDSLDTSKPTKASSPATSRMPSPPPKSKPPSSKKRKGAGASSSDSSPFEGLAYQDALAKLTDLFSQVLWHPENKTDLTFCKELTCCLSFQGQDHLLKAFETLSIQAQESSSTIEELRKISFAKEKHLNQKMEKVDKELKMALAEKIKMAKEKEQEMADYKKELMNSTAVSVTQARVKMAFQANDPTFHKSTWDVEAWQARIVALGGNEVVYPDPAQSSQASGKDQPAGDPKDTILKVAAEATAEAKEGNDGGDEKAWAHFFQAS